MKLLLATYNLPPESYGGTEVYLESLTAELARHGHSVELLAGSAAALPAGGPRFHLESGSCWDLPAWRLTLDGARSTMPDIYTTRCADLRAFWLEWLAQRGPDLLHLHGHSLTVSLSLMEAAAELRIPMVSTLHNVPSLCPRGDFLTWRGVVCDGRAELLKCIHCTTASRTNAMGGAMMAAATPLLSLLPVPASSGWTPLRSALHYPALQRMHLESQRDMLQIVTRWHVFSEWSRQALLLNGVSPERIVLLRHPHPSHSSHHSHASHSGPLRLGFFGRFNKVKGLAVLLDAIRRLPDAPLQLEIYGKAQSPAEELVEAQVREAAAADSRILWRGRIPHSEQPDTMGRLDVLVVPSLWIETGPLTVLEAFAAGVPVLGSDLSGINEWVRPDQNGWLFPPGNGAALAEKIASLCANRSLLEGARHFPAVDSAAVHAAGVMEIYESALAASHERLDRRSLQESLPGERI